MFCGCIVFSYSCQFRHDSLTHVHMVIDVVNVYENLICSIFTLEVKPVPKRHGKGTKMVLEHHRKPQLCMGLYVPGIQIYSYLAILLCSHSVGYVVVSSITKVGVEKILYNK